MIKFIFIQGIFKGIVICVFTNILIISTLLFSSLFLNGGRNNIIQLPVVLPLVSIIGSTLISQDIKLKHGIYIALVWFFIFVSAEILKVVGLGLNPIRDVYSILIIALIIIIPIGVGLSNTNFFLNKGHQSQE